MLGGERKQQRSAGVVFDFILNIGVVLCEFMAELGGDLRNAVKIIHNLNLAENDHAFDVQRPLIRLAVTIPGSLQRKTADFQKVKIQR